MNFAKGRRTDFMFNVAYNLVVGSSKTFTIRLRYGDAVLFCTMWHISSFKLKAIEADLNGNQQMHRSRF